MLIVEARAPIRIQLDLRTGADAPAEEGSVPRATTRSAHRQIDIGPRPSRGNEQHYLRHHGNAGPQAQVCHGVDIRVYTVGAVVEGLAAVDPCSERIALKSDNDRTALPIIAGGDAAKHAARLDRCARLREVEIAGSAAERSADPPAREKILRCRRLLVEQRRRPGIDDVGTENGTRDRGASR